MSRFFNWFQDQLDKTRVLDFTAPLLLRLYLAPIFWMAGTNKIDLPGLMPKDSVVQWFGNPEWGLGLPLPELMAFLAGWSEILGGLLLLTGLAVRWISMPLMVTMLVAAFSVHWKNGWQAIADPTMCLFSCDAAQAAVTRLDKAKDILKEHGNYEWLTEQGSFVVLNNGIEFAATYFIMLLALFFMGGGRFVSLDDWIARRVRRTV